MNTPKKKGNYRFSFGPWNISTGSDPFGPAVRKEVEFAAKVRQYRKLGFTHVQLHDDDVVPHDRYRPHDGHRPGGPVAGTRGDVYPRSQGCEPGGRPDGRGDQRHARL